jgi:TonB family protein
MKPSLAVALCFIFALPLAVRAHRRGSSLILYGPDYPGVVQVKMEEVDPTVDTPPRITNEAPIDYPIEMQRLNLRGEVKLRFTVDSDGRVRNPIVISSTNPGFNQAVIDAVLKWRFAPAVRHGVPVSASLEEAINFQMDDRRTGETGDEAAAASDNVDQSKLPPALRYDIPAKPANVVYPVYPFELLRDDVSGTAEAVYYVSPGGKAVRATVVKATRPEFGQAVLAMLDQWRFKPAMKDGKPTWTIMSIKQEFSEYSDDIPMGRDQLHEAQGDDELHVPVSDEELHLLHELKKEQPALCSIKDLDAPPQLLSPQPPVFPSALVGKATEGQAVVEFLIDHDGNVQLPRVISATAPAFGYAAVQGVSEWKFAALTSHGRPVDVRARIPIKFTLSL